MRARVAAVVVVLPLLLAACGGAVHPPSDSSSANVGCAGWFIVSHDTLAAHVQLVGHVRAVTVNALLDDGSTRGTSTPVAVAAGSAQSVVHVSHVDARVVSAAARVLGGSSTAQASCELSTPH